MTRVVMLGTTEFTLCCIRTLLDAGITVAALISLPQELFPLYSADIVRYAKEKRIQYHEVEDINSWGAMEILRRYEPDYMFSTVTTISPDMMNVPKKGIIGVSPDGAEQLQWLIMLDLTKYYLCFYKMSDKNEEILRIPFAIDKNDTIADAVRKMNEATARGIKKLARLIKLNRLVGKQQDRTKSNYWRKRTLHDVTIDPRMSADAIVRLVRSFTRPYPCANLIIKDTLLKVIYARATKTTDANIEQGKIIKIDGHILTFKADDAYVEAACENIPEHILKENYILPPSYYIAHHPELREKIVKMN